MVDCFQFVNGDKATSIFMNKIYLHFLPFMDIMGMLIVGHLA
jgi:hypothetical protein